MPDATTTINLVFRVTRDDGLPCTCDDLLMLDDHLGGDGDCLSLEGGRFDVVSVKPIEPTITGFGGFLTAAFDVEVEACDGDDMSPSELCAKVHDAAILHMPDFLVVEDMRATIA